MGKQRDGDRESFWRRVLRNRAESGLTVARFCAREGLKVTTYHYWQREIKRRNEERQAVIAEPLSGEPNGTPLLAAVRVVNDDRCTAAVEVIARNGYVVRIGEQATAEQVRRVLHAVSELE